MPKNQPQRVIDNPYSAVGRGGTSSTSAVSGGGLTAHDIDGVYHTGTLSWAKVSKTGSAISDLDDNLHSQLDDGEAGWASMHHDLVTLAASAQLSLNDQELDFDDTATFNWTGAHDFTAGITTNDIIWDNKEKTDFSDTDGQSYYDLNVADANLGSPGILEADTRGGIMLYNSEDGWGLQLSTANMEVVNAEFNSVRTASLLADANMSIAPAGALSLLPTAGEIAFEGSATWESDDFLQGALGTAGWQVEPNGTKSQLNIGKIVADELNVRVFTADETRVSRGNEIWSRSWAFIETEFTTPANYVGEGGSYSVNVYFENSPVIDGQLFLDGDPAYSRIMIQHFEHDGGLELEECWFTVDPDSYLADAPNDRQRYTLIFQSGPKDTVIEAGKLAIDWGTSGQGYIHLTTLDEYDGPHIGFGNWTTNPWTTTNRKEYVRIGNLEDIADYATETWGFAAAKDLSISPTTHPEDFEGITIDTTNGMRMYNTPIRMYSSGNQTARLNSNGDFLLGTDVSDLSTTGFRFSASGGYLYLGNVNAGYMAWSPGSGRISFADKSSGSVVIRAYIGTDGKVYAGDGTVTLDETGINILHDGSYEWVSDPKYALTFGTAGDIASIYTNNYGGDNRLIMEAAYAVGDHSRVELVTHTAADERTAFYVMDDGFFLENDGDQKISAATTITDWYAGENYNFNAGRMSSGFTNEDSLILSHEDFHTANSYCLKQNNSGDTALNAHSGQFIFIRNSNSTVMRVGASSVTMYQTLAMNDESITGAYAVELKERSLGSAPSVSSGYAKFWAGTDDHIYAETDSGGRGVTGWGINGATSVPHNTWTTIATIGVANIPLTIYIQSTNVTAIVNFINNSTRADVLSTNASFFDSDNVQISGADLQVRQTSGSTQTMNWVITGYGVVL